MDVPIGTCNIVLWSMYIPGYRTTVPKNTGKAGYMYVVSRVRYLSSGVGGSTPAFRDRLSHS